MTGLGHAAALATPLASVIGFTIWGDIWTGHPYMLNCFKGCVGTIFFITAMAIASSWTGDWGKFTTPTVLWLLLSSFIGIVVGDSCWLQAQQLISTREVILMDALTPGTSAVLAWMFLSETPTWGWCGALLTLVAVTWVSLEQKPTDSSDELQLQGVRENSSTTTTTTAAAATRSVSKVLPRWWGFVFAILNVSLDSAGSVLTKRHGSALQPWDIAGLRFGGASVFLLATIFVARLLASRNTKTAAGAGTRKSFYQFPKLARADIGWLILAISLTTYLSSMLRNFALFQIDLFYVSTLGATSPIWALLIATVRRERTSPRAWVGSCGAVMGVMILVWSEGGVHAARPPL